MRALWPYGAVQTTQMAVAARYRAGDRDAAGQHWLINAIRLVPVGISRRWRGGHLQL